MPREINDVGKTFGQLTVLRRVENAGNHKQYLCRCTCGNEEVVKALALRNGTKWRCRGCWLANIKRTDPIVKKLRSIYKNMQDRCYNGNNPAFSNYGARGIKVCARWRDADHGFENFVADMGEPLVNVKRWSIDRIDVDGDYEPSNCRWADDVTQANNRRSSRYLEHDGECRTLTEWERGLGLRHGVLRDRLKRGISFESASSPGRLILDHCRPTAWRDRAYFAADEVPSELTGRRFGDLTVVAGLRPLACGHARALVRCSCGNHLAVHEQQLTDGYAVGCGCSPATTVNKTLTSTTEPVGSPKRRARSVWNNIKQVCENPNNPRYKDNGAIGLKVIWPDLAHFVEDLGLPPSAESRLIHRPFNADYGPDTCRWSDGPTPAERRERGLITDEERVRTTPRRAWNFEDLTGKTFGRLTVTQQLEGLDNGHVVYRCRCTCGGEVDVTAQNLRRGSTTSCGCLVKEVAAQRSTVHGKSKTPTYSSFMNMHHRCEDPTNVRWDAYGGRGIRVCERWSGDGGFKRFLTDMGERPAGMTLDRIDVDGDYEPRNCRWAPEEVQAGNTRRRRTLTVDGETLSFAAWERRLGLSRGIIAYRVDKLGWPAERALTGAGASGRRASATADRWREVARRPVVINRRAYDAVVLAHHKVRVTVLVRPGAPAMILAGEADDAALARLIKDMGR